MRQGSQTAPEVQIVAFKLEDEEFAVDIHQVHEVLKLVPVTPLPQAAHFIEGVINLRGEVIPVIDLRKRFELPAQERNNQTRIIIVEIEEHNVGLIVDFVTEVLRLPAEAIQPPPARVAGARNELISGIGRLEGRLLIILNLAKILTMHAKIALEEVIPTPEEHSV